MADILLDIPDERIRQLETEASSMAMPLEDYLRMLLVRNAPSARPKDDA